MRHLVRQRFRDFGCSAFALLSLCHLCWPPWSCDNPNRTFVLAYRHLPLKQLLGAFVVGHSQTARYVNRGRGTFRSTIPRETDTHLDRVLFQPTMPHHTQYHTVTILALCLALPLNAQPAVRKRDNATVNAGPGEVNCVDSNDWWTGQFQPHNCYHALAVMTSRHVAEDPEMPYEFLAKKTTARTSFAQLQTPQWTSSGMPSSKLLSSIASRTLNLI